MSRRRVSGNVLLVRLFALLAPPLLVRTALVGEPSRSQQSLFCRDFPPPSTIAPHKFKIKKVKIDIAIDGEYTLAR